MINLLLHWNVERKSTFLKIISRDTSFTSIEYRKNTKKQITIFYIAETWLKITVKL